MTSTEVNSVGTTSAYKKPILKKWQLLVISTVVGFSMYILISKGLNLNKSSWLHPEFVWNPTRHGHVGLSVSTSRLENSSQIKPVLPTFRKSGSGASFKKLFRNSKKIVPIRFTNTSAPTALHSNQQNQLNNGEKVSYVQKPSSFYSSLLATTPRWLQLDKNNPQFSVYSAHFDDIESVPVVTVLLTGPGKAKVFPAVCVFFDSPEVSQPNDLVHGICQHYNPEKSGYGRYHGAYIKCPLPSPTRRPYAVSVFKSDVSRENTFQSYAPLMTNLMVINYSGRHAARTKLSPERWKLTKCFPVLFHYSNVHALIEQIEIHRLLGVEHFTMYMVSASPAVHTVLQYYIQEEVVEVFNWTLPKTNETKNPFFYFDQMDTIQDCLLRHLRSSRYVLFGDMDEIAVPRLGNSLVPLLDRRLAKQPECGGVLLLNAFFDLKYNGTDQDTNFTFWSEAQKFQIKSLLFEQRVNFTWIPGKRSKPIVMPTRVNVTSVHTILSFRGNYTSCVVSPSEGLLHHYRRIPGFISPKYKPELVGYVFDPYLRKFARDIVKRVKKMMQEFQKMNIYQNVRYVY